MEPRSASLSRAPAASSSGLGAMGDTHGRGATWTSQPRCSSLWYVSAAASIGEKTKTFGLTGRNLSNPHDPPMPALVPGGDGPGADPGVRADPAAVLAARDAAARER